MATTKGRMGASSTILNPLNSINKMGNVLGNNILIKTIDLEFEVRRSNLTDFYAHDDLPTCICDVKFDSANI